MKSLRFKLKKNKKEIFEVLCIKDINKKVKEPLSIKDKETEFNLVLILKSLNYILCHTSRSLLSNSDSSKQELNFLDIRDYLNKFNSKPYYKYKIVPLLEILNELYLKTKKEKAFIDIAKEMNEKVTEKKRITDIQIDCLNYMLIMNYERLLLLDNDVYDLFLYLKDIISFLTENYKYLYEYFLLIQLHTFNVIGAQKLKETQKINDKKKYIHTKFTKILFDIVFKTNNDTLLELAFILFCQYYLYFKDNSFAFAPLQKWVFLILKLLKGKIKFIYNENKENEYYSLSNIIHMKYYLGEIERNKKRKKPPENSRISVVSVENLHYSQTLLPNIKITDKYEAASNYLKDNTNEIYPKELSLPKGPSEIFFINLFKYNENEKENIKKNKDYFNNIRNEIIQGALAIVERILKFKYQKDNYAECNEQYFFKKLFDEVMKLFLKKDELHLIKRCLNCFGSILLKQPKIIIDSIPKIIKRISDNPINVNLENMVNQLNYFFKNCNTIFKQAFDNNDAEIIKKYNIITNNYSIMVNIVLLNPIIFKLRALKGNSNKSYHEKFNDNFNSLRNNYYIFCSSLLHNYLLLNNSIMTLYTETIINFYTENSPSDLLRKYLIKIITKIYEEKILKRIFRNLLIDKIGNLKLKTLFYILRYISSERNIKNNFIYLIRFLEQNNNIKISDVSKLFDFLEKHLINKDTKFYFIDFYKEKTSSKSVNTEFNDDENDNVEIYDTLNPKSNEKIFKYIIKIIFQCINESKEMDDIANIHKILLMLFINLVPLEQENIICLLSFLIEYLKNITQMINIQGHKIWQNYFKQYLEILNYVNLYINNNFKEENNIDKNYIHILINSYNTIILMLFKLIPNNLSSKEYNILNIIPIIYSYLLTLNNLYSFNDKENKDSEINTNTNITNSNNNKNISIELLNILNKYLINNKPKSQSAFNSCSISLYYIFYYIKNISKKEYFDIIYNIIIRSLNFDDFKYENNVINAANFILIKLCVKILFEEKDYITKEEEESLSFYDTKYQFIQKLHCLMKKIIKDNNDSNSNNVSGSINNDESKIDESISILKEMDNESKIELINKYFIFSSDSNFININLENHIKTDENKEEIIEKYKETKDVVNIKYKKWLVFIEKLLNSKSKKTKPNDANENIDALLNSSFSFSENKPIHFINIIKSLEIDNNDLKLFTDFLSILGNIIVKEKEVFLQKENVFENIIYKFDKFYIHGVVFVLIKKEFKMSDKYINFNGNFIVYIKPLSLKGIYLIKIIKNSDFKMKNNNAFKLLTQIDQDFNKVFSDFIILDTNNEKQINYFFNLIEMVFNYGFLEEQINL